METGIVLMNAEPSRSSEIGERLSHLPGVKQVFIVEGDYQLIASVAGKTPSDLSALIEKHLAIAEGVEVAKVLNTIRQFSQHEYQDEMVGFGP